MKIQAIRKFKKNFDQTNVEHLRAFDLITRGHHLFITGEGGTGKSYFIATLYGAAKKAGLNVAILTPTGISAINLNNTLLEKGLPPIAKTYHSHYGFIPGKNDAIKNYLYRKKIKEIDLLIIDEISMISDVDIERIHNKQKNPQANTKIEEKERVNLFGQKLPLDTENLFNNVQTIMFGDLFQLPPVQKNTNSNFFFESKLFKDNKIKTIAFYKNYRVQSAPDIQSQYETKLFKKLLREVRYGVLTKASKEILSEFNKSRIIEEDKILSALKKGYTLLSPINKKCKYYNNIIINSLDEKKVDLLANQSNDLRSINDNTILKMFNVERLLSVKIGQRIIITSNLTNAKNGQLGVIERLIYSNNVVDKIQVRLDSNELISISRKLYLKPTSAEAEKIENTKTIYVDFLKKNVKKWIEQFPIKDGYAITIHKSQGLSIDKLIIEPKTFIKGMFYVALSRAKNPKQIFFTQKIQPSFIMISKKVIKFYLENGLIEEALVPLVKQNLKL